MSPLNFNASHQFGFAPFDWLRATFSSLKDKIINRDIYSQEVDKSEFTHQQNEEGKLYYFPKSKLDTAPDPVRQPAREVRASYSQNQIGIAKLFIERWNPFPTESQKKHRASAYQLAQESCEIKFVVTQAEQVSEIIQSGDVVAITTLRSRLDLFKTAFMPVQFIENEFDLTTVEREEEVYLDFIIRRKPELHILKAFLQILSISSFKDDHVLLTTLVSRLYMYSQGMNDADGVYAVRLQSLIETHFKVAFMNEYS